MRTFVYLVMSHGGWHGAATYLLGIYVTVEAAIHEAWQFHQAGVQGVEVEEVPVGEYVEVSL